MERALKDLANSSDASLLLADAGTFPVERTKPNATKLFEAQGNNSSGAGDAAGKLHACTDVNLPM